MTPPYRRAFGEPMFTLENGSSFELLTQQVGLIQLSERHTKGLLFGLGHRRRSGEGKPLPMCWHAPRPGVPHEGGGDACCHVEASGKISQQMKGGGCGFHQRASRAAPSGLAP